MKVALISHEFPPFMFGGIGSFCYDLANALSKRKISTTVFSGRSQKIVVERPNEYLKVVRLPFFDFPPRSLWFQIRNFNFFKKKLKDYSILHGIYPQAGLFNASLRKKTGKPLVISVHGVPQYEIKSFLNSPISYWTPGDFGFNILEFPLNNLLTRVGLANSDHIVTCSYNTLSEMRQIYRDLDFANVSVIYNGIDFDKIDGLRSDRKSHNESLSIVFFGRIYYRKGLTYLIRAISNVKKDFPDVKLKIFGKGPLEIKLRSLVSSLGLRDEVIIRGHVPYVELIKEIRNANVVVLPSLYEAQPISVLEAMACKKPVVVFDYPFSRELIKDMYNGILVRPNDVDELYKKICLLLSENHLRKKLGANAYDYVKKRHNWGILVEKYIQIYEETIDAYDS